MNRREHAERRPRVLVFEDSVYRCADGALSTDRAFLYWTSRLAEHVGQLVLLGRLDPRPGRSYYALPADVELVGLPHYRSLVHPAAVPALVRSLRRAWAALGDVDVAWLMGPHPLSVVLVAFARFRGVDVVLGVRQDLPRYVRGRHPHRRWAHGAADVLEHLWRVIARRRPVVAVGPQLARHYARTPRLLEISICMVPEAEVPDAEVPDAEVPQADVEGSVVAAVTSAAAASGDDDVLRLLSVGRLDEEKNPLLLADVLALLRRSDPRWTLVVCGEGPLSGALARRLADMGLAEHAELRGYVPVSHGLLDVYRSAHVFLHVSWTEGLPQVLYEAWAARVPVVATAVGGVPEAAQDAALLVEAGDAAAAAAAVETVSRDLACRSALVAAGRRRLQSATLEDGVRDVGCFLLAAAPGPRRARGRA